jgi:hypothetical protein
MSEIVISMSPVAVSRANAAAALGVSLSFFEAEIQPELRLVRRKSKVLVPVAELERWATENAEFTLRAGRRSGKGVGSEQLNGRGDAPTPPGPTMGG